MNAETLQRNRFSAAWLRRGSRYPAGAHTVAVALRVDCAVVLGLGSAPRNSLCSLRSRRSNNRGENVDEVRCAHRPQPCAPRRHTDRPAGYRLTRVKGLVLRADTTPGYRRSQVPAFGLPGANYKPPFSKGVLGWAAARLCGAEEHSFHGCARSALRQHSHRGCPSAESEANAASSAMQP